MAGTGASMPPGFETLGALKAAKASPDYWAKANPQP
jgi:hypothetical protein